MSQNGLEPYRRLLDGLDDEIARHKLEHEIPMMQPHRVEAVREHYLARAEEADLPAEFAADFHALLIAATCKEEDELMAALEAERR